MTTPVSTPDAPRPITTAPAELAGHVRTALPFMKELAELMSAGDSEASKKRCDSAADFLRGLFPHLDDVTLAGFLVYAASNLYEVGQKSGSVDLLAMAGTWAAICQPLAWSLATPDAPEPSK